MMYSVTSLEMQVIFMQKLCVGSQTLGKHRKMNQKLSWWGMGLWLSGRACACYVRGPQFNSQHWKKKREKKKVNFLSLYVCFKLLWSQILASGLRRSDVTVAEVTSSPTEAWVSLSPRRLIWPFYKKGLVWVRLTELFHPLHLSLTRNKPLKSLTSLLPPA